MVGRGLAYTNDTSIGPNWIIMILPYIEQGNLINSLPAVTTSIQNYEAFSNPSGTGGSNDQGWRAIRSTVVKTLRCPSESFTDVMSSAVGGSWARGNYAANSGPDTPDGSANGASRQQGVAGGGPTFNAGGVMVVNWGSTIHGIEDGSSNTVLINHVRSGPIASDIRGSWAFGITSMTSGNAIGDCYTPNDTGCCSDDVAGCSDRPDMAMGCWSGGYGQVQARSQHTGGVLAAMGDGSVRFIRNAITPTTWFLMISRNDGQTWTDS